MRAARGSQHFCSLGAMASSGERMGESTWDDHGPLDAAAGQLAVVVLTSSSCHAGVALRLWCIPAFIRISV